ncbi:hypothetical protein GCM10020254_19770 [Streptomyces goshikiensis]
MSCGSPRPGRPWGTCRRSPTAGPGESVREFLARRTGVAAAQAELDAATQGLVDGTPGADDAYAEALDRWLNLGGADLDERARRSPTTSGWPSAWTSR